MLVMMAAVLLLYWLRDRAVLRMGSPRKVVHHAWIYSSFVSLGAIVVWMLTLRDDSLAHAVTSAPFVTAVAALQAVATLVSGSSVRSATIWRGSSRSSQPPGYGFCAPEALLDGRIGPSPRCGFFRCCSVC